MVRVLSRRRVRGQRNPIAALRAIGAYGKPSLVVLKDFHPYLAEPRIVRALRELGHALKSTYTTVILLAPVFKCRWSWRRRSPSWMCRCPPSATCCSSTEIIGGRAHGQQARGRPQARAGGAADQGGAGAHAAEAENAFAKAIANDQVLDASDIQLVMEEKRQVIRKSGLLEYYPAEHDSPASAGWRTSSTGSDGAPTRSARRARVLGFRSPRGCCSSACRGAARASPPRPSPRSGRCLCCASTWADIQWLIGSSEENLRRAIASRSRAPAVLWLDEIDKALSGSASSDRRRRRLGSRLRHLAHLAAGKDRARLCRGHRQPHGNHSARASAQGALRRDLLHRSSVVRERAERLAIHLRHRGRDPASFDVAQVALRRTASAELSSNKWWWRACTSPSLRV